MSKEKKNINSQPQENPETANPAEDLQNSDTAAQTEQQDDAQDAEANAEGNTEELSEVEKQAQEIENLKSELEAQKKEYLFLVAEFDNFRRRTLKEKQELIQNGGEKTIEALLPVVDDFERALDAIDKGSDVESLKEGVDLIYNKLGKFLKGQGVKPIDSNGATFDTELHEAVTTFPAADESQKGKVIDTVQRGYMLHDKVLRFAKVVVGQ